MRTCISCDASVCGAHTDDISMEDMYVNIFARPYVGPVVGFTICPECVQNPPEILKELIAAYRRVAEALVAFTDMFSLIKSLSESSPAVIRAMGTAPPANNDSRVAVRKNKDGAPE